MYKELSQLNQKWAKVLNTHFIKENIQMTNKHRKPFHTYYSVGAVHVLFLKFIKEICSFHWEPW